MKPPCRKTLYLTFVLNVLALKIIVGAEVVSDGQDWTHKDTAEPDGTKEGRRNLISPRMDFDQWTPLGRGDPLKNDPTFDYLPPVLDKVHYWKTPPPANRVHLSSASTVATVPVQTVVNYNRRFFLTDFSKREPSPHVVVQYTHKRPAAAAMTSAQGYHYPMPKTPLPTFAKTPLPMLTPPPYQSPTLVTTTTVEPMDMSSLLDAGNSAAESKQPPTVRAPPPSTATVVRPILSHSVIKVLLENEVDRTTVTTSPTTTTTTTTTTVPPPTTDPIFSHYKQSVVTGKPMYLIIQGHSKVKTYGPVSKPDDLSAAQSAAAVQEHNHIGNGPDERSRRKRGGGGGDGPL